MATKGGAEPACTASALCARLAEVEVITPGERETMGEVLRRVVEAPASRESGK